MFRRFYPKKYMETAYEIPYCEYFEKGIRGVIFDIDNTLTCHDAPADERAVKLFAELKRIGFETCLLSNNKEPRVASFAGQVGSKYIYKGSKPRIKNYKKAMQLMKTNEENTIFVGDQLFTDIYGANRSNIYSILVKPLSPKEEIQIVLKRRMETIVLYFYRKSKM